MSRRERTEKIRTSVLDSFFLSVINFKTEDEYWDQKMYNFLYDEFISLLCSDDNLDYSIIKRWPDKKWNWYQLSKNKNFDFKFFRENLNNRWLFFLISKNPNIVNHFDVVFQNIHRSWNFKYLINNYDTCMDLILYKPPRRSIIHEYYYKKLSRRIYETNRYDLVEKLPDEDWDWKYFSSCNNLDLNLVKLLPNKDWDYDLINKLKKN